MPRAKSISRAGAALAGISYNRFLGEAQARRVVILEDPAFVDQRARVG